MEINWPVAGSWALAACSTLALAGYFLVRRAKRYDERWGEYKRRIADEIEASKRYADAVRNGTKEDAIAAARELDEKRQALDALRKALHALAVLSAAGVLLVSQGCVTRTKEVERIVALDAHIRIVEPGETVPDYAPGESRWWLVSPSGLVELMPKYRQREF